jgi:hypothetical protein
MRKRTLNHHVNVALLLLAGICGQGACAGGPATRPDGLGRTYAGEWTGTTSEGTAIAFDVSLPDSLRDIVGHAEDLGRLPVE